MYVRATHGSVVVRIHTFDTKTRLLEVLLRAACGVSLCFRFVRAFLEEAAEASDIDAMLHTNASSGHGVSSGVHICMLAIMLAIMACPELDRCHFFPFSV